MVKNFLYAAVASTILYTGMAFTAHANPKANNNTFSVSGQIVDVVNSKIFPGKIDVVNGRIKDIRKLPKAPNQYIMPGLVDAHVHIESSMVVPSEFARIAVTHGTVATVSDPHEIANVLGIEGVHFMLNDAQKVPFKFNFGAPPCVPATTFETSGANLGISAMNELLKRDDIKFMSEMMNYPGVIYDDAEVLGKLAIAQKYGKPIDGHAPLVTGSDLDKYISTGISTDHEASTYAEGEEKIQKGMKIIIREGSAAKDFNNLASLVNKYPSMVMFGSDDKHPDDLIKGHINELIKRAIAPITSGGKGLNVMKVLKAATYNPIKHYNLDVGLLQKGDEADFIIINNFTDFKVAKTYIDGQLVAENGKSKIKEVYTPTPNNFALTKPYSAQDFALVASSNKVRVIGATDGLLLTDKLEGEIIVDENGMAQSNLKDDILKMAVINRYKEAPIALGFIKGFNLKEGAIATSVSHDSHNIAVVGTNDESIAKAVNKIIKNKGGLVAVSNNKTASQALPVGGIMSNEDAHIVAQNYVEVDRLAKELGSQLKAPYMTLSFMSLLVIPHLKLGDKGLFDGDKFDFTDLFIID